jgi:hypothetical protein
LSSFETTKKPFLPAAVEASESRLVSFLSSGTWDFISNGPFGLPFLVALSFLQVYYLLNRTRLDSLKVGGLEVEENWSSPLRTFLLIRYEAACCIRKYPMIFWPHLLYGCESYTGYILLSVFNWFSIRTSFRRVPVFPGFWRFDSRVLRFALRRE